MIIIRSLVWFCVVGYGLVWFGVVWDKRVPGKHTEISKRREINSISNFLSTSKTNKLRTPC